MRGLEVRGSKVAQRCGSILTSILMAAVFAAVIVSWTGKSFAGEPEVSSDAKSKTGGSGLQVSLLYPANGVLGSNQTQMIQVGVTVTPKTGTSLGSYRLHAENADAVRPPRILSAVPSHQGIFCTDGERAKVGAG